MAEGLNIRDYLLGILDDPEHLDALEKRYLTDDDFAARVAGEMDELYEQYLDGDLSDLQRNAFETHFLVNEDRRHQLEVIRALRAAGRSTPGVQTASGGEADKRSLLGMLFANPFVRYGFAVVLIAVIGIGFWRFAIYRSNIDLGLAQLREAYAGERPVESRITDLSYSPFRTTRGVGDDKEKAARDRAEKLLTLAAGESDDARSQAALGKFYLTQRKFEQANELFAKAAAAAPNDARIHADWGASLLELARIKVSAGEKAEGLENFDASLAHLETAIKLMPTLLDARFNRALCLQQMMLNEQAKAAWLEYLSYDSSSPWADEARHHLEKLNATSSNELPADEVLAGFLRAAAAGDDAQAFSILSGNRELISKKYVPQRLAMSVVNAADADRPELLNAMDLAGRLESERIGDNFAARIAAYYRRLNGRSIDALREAQAAVQRGYALCLSGDYALALAEFSSARRIFDAQGDVWESNLSRYFEGYCLINVGNARAGLETIEKVVRFARTENYAWLEMTALYWLAGSNRNLRQHSVSKLTFLRAIAIAEKIGDRYGLQRNLLDLAQDGSFLGQHTTALDGIYRALEVSNAGNSSLRQRCRLSIGASDVFLAAGHLASARNAAEDAVALAGSVNDKMLAVISRNKAGAAYLQAGDPATARRYFDAALSDAQSFSDETSRNKMSALSYLQMAGLARSGGDVAGSTELYRRADELYDSLSMPFYRYVSEKGVLSGLKELGDNAELDRLLPSTIKLAEDYQEKISEEAERASFLDDGITIYDLALEREFEKGDLAKAFDFSELSVSRTLYQRLAAHNGAAPRPLTIDEIREKMPARTQILKFSVVKDRTLVWVISKRDVSLTPVEISSDDLRARVERYNSALSRPDADLGLVRELSRELYGTLIAPVSEKLDPDLDLAIVPNKFLFYLPFASLMNERNEPLIAAHPLSFSPSASVFVICSDRASRAAKASESVVAVGDPSFDRNSFPDLSVLPAASDEAAAVRAQYTSGSSLLGPNAVKSELLRSIRHADVLHFAGHYVVVDREPDSSFLLLAKGPDSDASAGSDILTNAELAQQDLGNLGLVVLSACQTGIDKYLDGEGMVGITRTFLAAGVPSVVASQWPVDSEATAILMKDFHKLRRSGGLSNADALRRAQLDLAASNGGRYASPYYWASFSLIGGVSK